MAQPWETLFGLWPGDLWPGDLWPSSGTVVPVFDPEVKSILYGSRSTSFRYELLAHDPATGADTLTGYLDGVIDGSLAWQSNASVKNN